MYNIVYLLQGKCLSAVEHGNARELDSFGGVSIQYSFLLFVVWEGTEKIQFNTGKFLA
jgi:hypothetical protein